MYIRLGCICLSGRRCKKIVKVFMIIDDAIGA